MKNLNIQQDETSIRALEAAYDKAWKDGDIDAIMSYFIENAVVVNPLGVVSSGKAEIRKMLGEFLSGPGKDSKHTSIISRIDFIKDDVAIVDAYAVIDDLRLSSDSNEATVTHHFTDIVVKLDNEWKFAHVRAYTFVKELH